MMGLGYKRIHQQLMHPIHQQAMRRADENLSDLIILGAIITFAAGTFAWIITEDALPVMLDYYPNRQAYMPFLYGLLALLMIYLFLYWALFPARIWPRVAMIVASLLVGMPVSLFGIINASSIGQGTAFALLSIYTISVSSLSIFQIIKVAIRIRNMKETSGVG